MPTIQITIRGGDSMGLTIREQPPGGTQRTMNEALNALKNEIYKDEEEQNGKPSNHDAGQGCTV